MYNHPEVLKSHASMVKTASKIREKIKYSSYLELKEKNSLQQTKS